MQKINAKCPQISDEKKTSFAPLINNFLIIILKNQTKVICQKGQNFFFNQKSEGILHLFFAGT